MAARCHSKGRGPEVHGEKPQQNRSAEASSKEQSTHKQKREAKKPLKWCQMRTRGNAFSKSAPPHPPSLPSNPFYLSRADPPATK